MSEEPELRLQQFIDRFSPGIATTRHVKLRSQEDFWRPRVDSLIEQALARAAPPLDSTNSGRVVIKSVSAKQRPRRPG